MLHLLMRVMEEYGAGQHDDYSNVAMTMTKAWTMNRLLLMAIMVGVALMTVWCGL